MAGAAALIAEQWKQKAAFHNAGATQLLCLSLFTEQTTAHGKPSVYYVCNKQLTVRRLVSRPE